MRYNVSNMDVVTQLIRTHTPPTLTLTFFEKKFFLILGFALTLCVAVGLRFYGLSWDSGYTYTPHPDERAILMQVSSLSFPALNDIHLLFNADESPWNPRWFPYGSFPLYLLKSLQIASSVSPLSELIDLRIAGRVLSALADIGTVVMIFLLGLQIYGRREGLLSALLISLAVLHIQLSHFYTVDTLLSFSSVVAIYFMFLVARDGKLRNSLLAGLFIGIGLSTKVSMAPIYLAFIMAHLMILFPINYDSAIRSLSQGAKLRKIMIGLLGGIIISVAAISLVQPYVFLDWHRFYADVVEQSEMVQRIRDYPYTRQYIDTTPYWYQIKQLATWGLGWPLGITAWCGLAYVSLRGARLRYGITYLIIGWGAPAVILLASTSFFAISISASIAFVALLAYLPVRSPKTRLDLLILAWVVPYLLITGSLEVKFLRYIIPITPFLVLFGSRMIFAMWNWIKPTSKYVSALLIGILILLIVSTTLYALSYTAIYMERHTAVRTSEWINTNVPAGAIILKEHWEEGLPNLEKFEIRELSLYEKDNSAKVRSIANQLSEADYLAFFSNRLYGTIPRLPKRYPFTTEYYHLLFSEQLGYKLAYAQTAYPRIAGVSLPHDTFTRANLIPPTKLESFEPAGLSLNLGFADESFSVYDHPTSLLFRNVDHLNAETIESLILTVKDDTSLESTPSMPTVKLISQENMEIQRQKGTWYKIVRMNSWTNTLPVLAWLVIIEGLALLVWPFNFLVFRALADRGYLFAKMMGLLGISILVWLLASTHLAPFSNITIYLTCLLLFVSALVILKKNRQEITIFIRKRWPILLISEVVFLIAFLSFILIRMANPDLWHPYLGGEKPMDQAYLNAILRSNYMPPYDPWFAGAHMNYYYWGHFIVATLIKTTGINPAVAFNLSVALFFALTIGSAFSISYNLAENTRLARLSDHTNDRWSNKWTPIAAGITGASFVAILGNLDGAIQIGQGIWRVVVSNLPYGTFDFWRSSRMMSPGNEITEFPFFTFLFGDLHAHLIALPFTLLALGLALTVLLESTRKPSTYPGESRKLFGSSTDPRLVTSATTTNWSAREITKLSVLGVVVGALRVINTWDYPTYLLIAFASVSLAEYFRNGGIGVSVLVRAGLKMLVVFSSGYLIFMPFHLTYEVPFDTAFNILDTTTNRTMLWQFLSITGLFIFIISSFFIKESANWLFGWLPVIKKIIKRQTPLSNNFPRKNRVDNRRGIAGMQINNLSLIGIVLIGFGLSAFLLNSFGNTVLFLIIIELIVLVTTLRFLRSSKTDSLCLTFTAILVTVSLFIAIGLDIFRIRDDIDRMNSVFKFYMQIWVMLALASAYLLWILGHERKTSFVRLPAAKKLWLVGLSLLIIGTSVYPILGSQSRLRTRFEILPMTLDGTAYMQSAIYHDLNGKINISSDYKGIQWLQNNLEGTPVILEGFTPQYRWGGRISVHTGLPTVIGWKWHQEQQRWKHRKAVEERVRDVNIIYSSSDRLKALSLINKYRVEYIYVGQLERLYYPESGLAKFDPAVNTYFNRVFHNDHVDIYRVKNAYPSLTISR